MMIVFKVFRLTMLSICALIVTGCAFGSKMSFDKTRLALPPSKGQVVVAVWDARPYVLTGEKSSKWVGLQRSGFGIPYGVHTASGQPLSNEFAQSIVASFNSSGTNAHSINLPPTVADRAAVIKDLPTVGKVVLLEISQWKTDTMADVNFDYALKLSVLNNGKVSVTEQLEGNEKLAGSAWNPVGKSERLAVQKQKEKLEQLFASSTIAKALAK